MISLNLILNLQGYKVSSRLWHLAQVKFFVTVTGQKWYCVCLGEHLAQSSNNEIHVIVIVQRNWIDIFLIYNISHAKTARRKLKQIFVPRYLSLDHLHLLARVKRVNATRKYPSILCHTLTSAASGRSLRQLAFGTSHHANVSLWLLHFNSSK